MYRFTRTATIKTGADVPRVIGVCKEINAHIAKSLDLDVKFGLEVFNQSRAHWSMDFASLSEFEEKFAKMMADADYWTQLESTRDLWIDGSIEDRMFMVIE